MRHAVTLAHLCTSLKFLRHTFFSMSKTDMDILREAVFCTPRRPTNALALRTSKWTFYWEVSQHFKCNHYSEMLMDGYSKNSNNLFLTVCSYHVTYAFQSESTLYSCLNVKELLARSRREI